jgi:hypothetical protein
MLDERFERACVDIFYASSNPSQQQQQPCKEVCVDACDICCERTLSHLFVAASDHSWVGSANTHRVERRHRCFWLCVFRGYKSDMSVVLAVNIRLRLQNGQFNHLTQAVVFCCSFTYYVPQKNRPWLLTGQCLNRLNSSQVTIRVTVLSVVDSHFKRSTPFLLITLCTSLTTFDLAFAVLILPMQLNHHLKGI